MNTSNTTVPAGSGQDAALDDIVGSRSGGQFLWRALWTAATLIAVAGATLIYFRQEERVVAPQYLTDAVTVGTLVVTVSATGNLQPTNQVDVGSELSGIVAEVYVDDNDRVQKGQLLARLDLAKLEDAVARSRAGLAAAEASVLQAQATVAEARATLARFRQVAQLSGGKVPSKTEMDTAEANMKRALADEASAHASVSQARAELQSNETDVEKAGIRSPIDGVVLSRQVEPGQTVAASFQAPVLFKLAEDLSKMELQVDVDEADVGKVEAGQKATFTVDAWPGRQYEAVITRVDYGSQEKDGVISYRTVLKVQNDDLSLRPGMTGTAEITTITRENVLLVPNAALRYTPPAAADGATKTAGRGLVGVLIPRPPPPVRKARPMITNGTPRVWLLRDGQPVAVAIQTGPSNGRVTEVLGGPLEAGMQVITESVSTPP